MLFYFCRFPLRNIGILKGMVQGFMPWFVLVKTVAFTVCPLAWQECSDRFNLLPCFWGVWSGGLSPGKVSGDDNHKLVGCKMMTNNDRKARTPRDWWNELKKYCSVSGSVWRKQFLKLLWTTGGKFAVGLLIKLLILGKMSFRIVVFTKCSLPWKFTDNLRFEADWHLDKKHLCITLARRFLQLHRQHGNYRVGFKKKKKRKLFKWPDNVWYFK